MISLPKRKQFEAASPSAHPATREPRSRAKDVAATASVYRVVRAAVVPDRYRTGNRTGDSGVVASTPGTYSMRNSTFTLKSVPC